MQVYLNTADVHLFTYSFFYIILLFYRIDSFINQGADKERYPLGL